MYTPSHFRQDDPAETMAFMQRYPFATLVSCHDGSLMASHLPLLTEATENGGCRLLGHMARQNPQWQGWDGQSVLVVFSEPHAYVSPGWYEKELNVPTWNYIAVHAYGRPQRIDDPTTMFELLEKQIATYEAAYQTQWLGLPPEYKDAMLKGIVAFEIPVEKLEAKWKLSQNKSTHDRQTVQNRLAESPHSLERDLAAYMDPNP